MILTHTSPCRSIAHSRDLEIARWLISVVSLTALIALGAQIEVPLYPVPVTLQTLFVLMGGAFFPLSVAVASPVLYIFAGFFAPIYANKSCGLTVLLGPTGGYLIGFVLASSMIAYFLGRQRSTKTPSIALLFLAANAAIYVPGLLQLYQVTHLPFAPLLMSGLLVFIPGDLLKIIILTSLWTSRIRADR